VAAGPSVEGVDPTGWDAGFDDMFAVVAGRFPAATSRLHARDYLRGLLSGVERENGWSLAEHAGRASPDGMQRLLNFHSWDADAARDDLRSYVVDHLGDPDGVLVVDETGFVKKGTKSAGVQRQYSGTAGRIENCQLGVFLTYASPRGRALIDRELYLPDKAWARDAARRAEAGVPEDVVFRTKPALAKAMIERAHAAGVPFAWVAGDEVYGGDPKLAAWLEDHRIGYVLAVSCDHQVRTPAGKLRVDDLAGRVPRRGWQTLSCGEGAKGPRLYDWAVIDTIEVRDGAGTPRRVLIRRSLADPDELAYFVCHPPNPTPLRVFVQVAGARWTIEECFQAAKNEVGLDHYQVRLWHAWYRHITLAMLAHAFLAVTAARAAPPPPPEHAPTTPAAESHPLASVKKGIHAHPVTSAPGRGYAARAGRVAAAGSARSGPVPVPGVFSPDDLIAVLGRV
jgi:SRSO17 transposase